jgi:hypothetical protein
MLRIASIGNPTTSASTSSAGGLRRGPRLILPFDADLGSIDRRFPLQFGENVLLHLRI